MTNFFIDLLKTENYLSVGAPGWLWIALIVLLVASYKAGKGEFNPAKSTFSLSDEVNKELNLSWWQICTLAVAIYAIRALLEGISYKEVAILYSGISIYISLFGLYTLNIAKSKINSINIQNLKAKLGNGNINPKASIGKIKIYISLTNCLLWILFIASVSIMITSLLFDINWLWIVSFIMLFISFMCQSIVILIDKLMIKN